MKAKRGRPKIVGDEKRVHVRIRLPMYKVDKIKIMVSHGRFKNITQLIENAIDVYLGYE